MHYSKKNWIAAIVDDIKSKLRDGEAAIMGATGNGSNKGWHEWMVTRKWEHLFVYDATSYKNQWVAKTWTELSQYLSHQRRTKYQNEAIIFAKRGGGGWAGAPSNTPSLWETPAANTPKWKEKKPKKKTAVKVSPTSIVNKKSSWTVARTPEIQKAVGSYSWEIPNSNLEKNISQILEKFPTEFSDKKEWFQKSLVSSNQVLWDRWPQPGGVFFAFNKEDHFFYVYARDEVRRFWPAYGWSKNGDFTYNDFSNRWGSPDGTLLARFDREDRDPITGKMNHHPVRWRLDGMTPENANTYDRDILIHEIKPKQKATNGCFWLRQWVFDSLNTFIHDKLPQVMNNNSQWPMQVE